jgi:hypothetical protein
MESLSQITGELFADLPPRAADSGRPKSAARLRQEADWQRQLAQAFTYQYARARSDDERQALDAEYEKQLAAGPEFTRYRRGSEFRDAPKVSIDRNAVARIRFMIQCIRRGTWHAKGKGKHHGGIPHSTIEVFDALLMLAVKYGKVFPSLLRISELATRSKQTVVNALKVLEFYGFITVHRRIKRVRTALGIKTVQDTNAYVIQEPCGFGRQAFDIFRQSSESRNQAAIRTQLYNFREENAQQGVRQPPWGIPDGVFASTG